MVSSIVCHKERCTCRARNHLQTLVFTLLCGIAIFSCRPDAREPAPAALPAHLLEELGRYLFFDPRLSHNGTRSCASCHAPEKSFTDGYRRSVSPAGENLKHNAPSLLNAGELKLFDWAKPDALTLEKQLLRPLFGKDPPEMGLDRHWPRLQTVLMLDWRYRRLWNDLFPGERPQTEHITKALAAFVQNLRSHQSPFDYFLAGDSLAMQEEARRGYRLFVSERLNCATCHPPPGFTLAAQSADTRLVYAQTGLYNIANQNCYPENDAGLAETTHLPEDHGRFRIPSLRQVSLTAPYMHDGSVETLGEVIDLYAQGGRHIRTGPNSGDGTKNRYRDTRLRSFTLSPSERGDLLAFLGALSDTQFFQRPDLHNPFLLE